MALKPVLNMIGFTLLPFGIVNQAENLIGNPVLYSIMNAV